MSYEVDMLRHLKQQIEERVSSQKEQRRLAFEKEKQALRDEEKAREVEKQAVLTRLREIEAHVFNNNRRKERLESDYHIAMKKLDKLREVWLSRVETSAVTDLPAASTSRQTPGSLASRQRQPPPVTPGLPVPDPTKKRTRDVGAGNDGDDDEPFIRRGKRAARPEPKEGRSNIYRPLKKSMIVTLKAPRQFLSRLGQ